MRKLKRIFALNMVGMFLLSIVLTFALSGCSETTQSSESKINVPNVEENVFIYDLDNQIEDNVEKKLNNLLIELRNKTEIEFAVVSEPSLNGMTIEQYANKLFNTLGLGQKDKNNGLLLLFSKADNKVRVEIGSGLTFLTAGRVGEILDQFFVPQREENNYTEATRLTVNALVNDIALKYDIQIDGSDTSVVATNSEGEMSIGYVILLLMIIIVVVIVLVLGGGGGSSGGYYGGGGHYSSGGGTFGGFSGGFSGGRGVSR